MTSGRLIGSPLNRIVTAQVIATFLASALCLAYDQALVVSALAAGICAILPGLYLLVMSGRQIGPGDSGLGVAVKGEVGRFVLTGCLFALVFVFVEPLNIVAFFATFVMLQLCLVIVPWLEARRLLKHHVK